MQNTKGNINKFSENNNVLEYTPPKVTKNFLKELIETKLCCCGSELDPKKNKDRVEATKLSPEIKTAGTKHIQVTNPDHVITVTVENFARKRLTINKYAA